MKQLFSSFVFFQLFFLQNGLFAQSEPGAISPPKDQSFIQTIVMIAIAMTFFYFILWRPEQKKRKELEEQRDSLKKGDRVSVVGILGTVSRVQAETVILKMVDGAKIEVLRAAINEVVPTENKGKEEKKEKSSEKKSKSSKTVDITEHQKT